MSPAKDVFAENIGFQWIVTRQGGKLTCVEVHQSGLKCTLASHKVVLGASKSVICLAATRILYNALNLGARSSKVLLKIYKRPLDTISGHNNY